MLHRIIALALLPAALAAQTGPNGTNAATIYGPVFTNVAAWGDTYTNFGRYPATNAASAEAAAAYRDLLPDLTALQGAADATYCNWGTRFEDGPGAQLPYISPAMRSARAALWAADYALSNNLPSFASHALEALRLARNVGEDQLLISLLVQVAGEKPAAEMLAAHLDRLDDRQVEALAAELAALPPGGTILDAARSEKTMFVDHLIKKFMEAMREADTNVFEVVPATDAMSGTAGTNSPGAKGTASWITENLRLSSVVDTSHGCWIGFEMRDGSSFTVKPGRPSHGVDLLSADVERGEAVIARGAETALVKLKSREITPFRLRMKLPRAPSGSPATGTNTLMALFSLTGDEELARGLQEVGDSPEAFLALLQKTSADYDEWYGAVQRLPLDEFRVWQEAFLKRSTVLTRLILPAMDRVMEKNREMEDARARLDAALAARRR